VTRLQGDFTPRADIGPLNDSHEHSHNQPHVSMRKMACDRLSLVSTEIFALSGQIPRMLFRVQHDGLVDNCTTNTYLRCFNPALSTLSLSSINAVHSPRGVVTKSIAQTTTDIQPIISQNVKIRTLIITLSDPATNQQLSPSQNFNARNPRE